MSTSAALVSIQAVSPELTLSVLLSMATGETGSAAAPPAQRVRARSRHPRSVRLDAKARNMIGSSVARTGGAARNKIDSPKLDLEPAITVTAGRIRTESVV